MLLQMRGGDEICALSRSHAVHRFRPAVRVSLARRASERVRRGHPLPMGCSVGAAVLAPGSKIITETC
jgi:hypothetical protein